MSGHRSLDDWITGNQGYDHPDNFPALVRCGICAGDFESENMSADRPDDICATCYTDGERYCEFCGEYRHLDEMLADEQTTYQQRKAGKRFFEYFCEDCKEELCINCKGHPDFCRDDLCLIPAREAEEIEKGEK
jgi:hypothetical protein